MREGIRIVKRYYLSWFEQTLPHAIAQILKEGLADTSFLVLISGDPSGDQWEQVELITKRWFQSANIQFKDYQLIDYRTTKEQAQQLLKQATTIFLCGGYPLAQNQFLHDYQLMELIKESPIPVIGASAGAINLSAEWLFCEYTGNESEKPSLIKGIQTDDFFFFSMANCDIHDERLLAILRPLSKRLPIYVAVNECLLAIEDGEEIVVGEIYQMRNQ